MRKEIDNENYQINNLIKQEKEYWKQLAQIIEKLVNKKNGFYENFIYFFRRTNLHRSIKTSSNTQPIVVVNKTFVMHIDNNNENLPPLKYNSNVPKTRKNKNCIY